MIFIVFCSKARQHTLVLSALQNFIHWVNSQRRHVEGPSPFSQCADESFWAIKQKQNIIFPSALQTCPSFPQVRPLLCFLMLFFVSFLKLVLFFFVNSDVLSSKRGNLIL